MAPGGIDKSCSSPSKPGMDKSFIIFFSFLPPQVASKNVGADEEDDDDNDDRESQSSFMFVSKLP